MLIVIKLNKSIETVFDSSPCFPHTLKTSKRENSLPYLNFLLILSICIMNQLFIRLQFPFIALPYYYGLLQAAAMFKVMRDTPPIPETLSPQGKDFLRCCFRRNPAERPTAAMLLEHRFLKSTLQLDVPSSLQLLNAMKLPVNM